MAGRAGGVSSDRSGAIAGIVFVVLMVAGWALSSTAYPSETSDYNAFYSETGHRVRGVAAAYLVMAAGAAMIWFVVTVHRRITDGDPSARTLATASVVSGTVYVVLHLVGAMAAFAAPLGATWSNVELDTDIIDHLEFLGVGMLFLPALMAAAVFTLTASMGARRAKLLPGWLVVVGYVVAVGCALGALIIPYLVWLVWILAVSIALLKRTGARSPTADAITSGWPAATPSARFAGPGIPVGSSEALDPYLREPDPAP